MQNQGEEKQMGHSRMLKFRAWDTVGQRMIDDLICFIPQDGITKVQHSNEFNAEDGYMWNMRDLVVMQWTGLKDKHGKEIYEGDIVKHRDLSEDPLTALKYGLVTALEGVIPQEVKYEACGFSPFIGWTDDANADMGWEVIGNIYENPELLNK